MANVLTGLIPDFIEGMNIVSRELVGMIPAVRRDMRLDRVALNQNVTIPLTRDATASATNTPGVTAPDTGDATVDNISVTISNSKHQPIRFNGEETLGLTNSGVFSSLVAERSYQAIRRLTNEIEIDLWTAGKAGASRAFGTAGTTPFATAVDMSDFAGARRILEENGAPTTDMQMVLGHSAMANLRGKQSGLFKVNESGDTNLLRNGLASLPVMGMALRHSDAVGTHTKGTGAAYTTTAAGFAVGTTTIPLITGTGTVLAGDVLAFAGDTNKYIVSTGIAAPGSIVLAEPGLRIAIAAAATAVTVGNSYAGNLVFDRNAIVLAMRMPAMPEGGDSAVDVTQLTDPLSGLTFEFALYKQFLQNVIHVRAAWGVKSIKARHVGSLLG